MFENIIKFFKNIGKKEEKNNETENSKDAAKERLHLVLMQDRANVSADFLELMKQEIIDVIKKYIDVDEGAIDVRLTNKENEDGTNGAPALYANIPIKNIKNEARKVDKKELEKNKNEQKAEIEEQQENAQNNPEQEQKEQKEPKEQQEETKLEEEKKENKESEEKIKEKEETKNNHKKK